MLQVQKHPFLQEKMEEWNMPDTVKMVYQKVPTDLKFVEREKEVEKFWKENKIFEKSIDSRREGEPYVFYDGPPTANGKPHIGHVLTRAVKDMIPRYHAMKGCMVPRKAGWDTHGLPVELEVEKMLGLDALRSCPTAHAAAHPCPPTRWLRAIRISRSGRRWPGSR